MSGPSLAADLGSLPAEAHQTRTFEFPKRSFGKKVVVNRSYHVNERLAILAESGSETTSEALKIQNFPGGACPHTLHALHAHFILILKYLLPMASPLLICFLHHWVIESQRQPHCLLYTPTVIRVSRTLENIMGECFANEIVQWCGKGYEIEVTKMGQNYTLFLQCMGCLALCRWDCKKLVWC